MRPRAWRRSTSVSSQSSPVRHRCSGSRSIRRRLPRCPRSPRGRIRDFLRARSPARRRVPRPQRIRRGCRCRRRLSHPGGRFWRRRQASVVDSSARSVPVRNDYRHKRHSAHNGKRRGRVSPRYHNLRDFASTPLNVWNASSRDLAAKRLGRAGSRRSFRSFEGKPVLSAGLPNS